MDLQGALPAAGRRFRQAVIAATPPWDFNPLSPFSAQ
jgi:hypothetical protein